MDNTLLPPESSTERDAERVDKDIWSPGDMIRFEWDLPCDVTRSVIIIIIPITTTTPLSNVLALMWRDVVWGWTTYNRQEMFFHIVLVGGAASDDNCGKNSHSTPSNLIHPQENVPSLSPAVLLCEPPSLACLFIYL